jgi:hydroxypyruvate reductase
LEALARTGVERGLERHVRYADHVLEVGSNRYPIDEFEELAIISIGKAAAPMCSYFLHLLDPTKNEHPRVLGIGIGPSRPVVLPDRVRWFPGSHPLPTQHSVDAADAVIEVLRNLGDKALVLFLISGGASAMLEKPLDESISIADVAAFHCALIGSGISITDANVVRKHFSAVKGGRLASWAPSLAQCTVLISDVPGDVPHIIGSGPSLPDPSTWEHAATVLRNSGLQTALPESVAKFFQSSIGLETPKPGALEFSRANWVSVLSSRQLVDEARILAEASGYHVVIDDGCDDWPYRDAADYLLDRLNFHLRTHNAVCLLSAGEISVPLNGVVGIGGRNQHFVLYCATKLNSADEGTTVLSAGSDGIDGSSPAAGAVADWTSRQRAEAIGLDLTECLNHFDSYPLLDALGDTICTGPTGNNLRDLRILVGRQR